MSAWRVGRASSWSSPHGRKEGGYRNALFDLDADPEEAIDVAAAHPKQALRLSRARGIPTRGSPPKTNTVLGDLFGRCDGWRRAFLGILRDSLCPPLPRAATD